MHYMNFHLSRYRQPDNAPFENSFLYTGRRPWTTSPRVFYGNWRESLPTVRAFMVGWEYKRMAFALIRHPLWRKVTPIVMERNAKSPGPTPPAVPMLRCTLRSIAHI